MSLITFKTEKGINLKIQPFCVFAFLQNLEKKSLIPVNILSQVT